MKTSPPQPDLLGMSVRDFLAAVASREATPGGGSVAGVSGATGTALAEMALAFTRGKQRFAQHEQWYAKLAPRLARARGMFEDLVADDVQAYRFFCETSAAEDSPQKSQQVQLALAAAIDVPRETTKLALAVLQDCESLADRCNRYLLSDLAAGATLLAAAARLSDHNVGINAGLLANQLEAKELTTGSADDVNRAEAIVERIEQKIRS